jgi:DNA-directed RNA polymerase subunit H (RpoH/RPB5)
MEVLARLKMNEKEQTIVILDNFTKMLHRRNIIKNQKNTLEKLKSITDTKGVYNIKEEQDILLVITYQKLNGIKKGSDIEEYLIKSKATYKFIICKDSSAKTYSQVKDFKGELFTTLEFLSDIPSNPLIPEHILLTEEQKEEVLKVYQEKNIAKILQDDMMVRYIGAKKGDLIRIIRSSLNTGESIYYRRVI